MCVIKNPRALLLQFDAGIGILLAERMHDRSERGTGGLGFVGEGELVEDGLKVLGGARELVSGLIRAGAFDEKLRLRRRTRIGVERINGFLRVS